MARGGQICFTRLSKKKHLVTTMGGTAEALHYTNTIRVQQAAIAFMTVCICQRGVYNGNQTYKPSHALFFVARKGGTGFSGALSFFILFYLASSSQGKRGVGSVIFSVHFASPFEQQHTELMYLTSRHETGQYECMQRRRTATPPPPPPPSSSSDYEMRC